MISPRVTIVVVTYNSEEVLGECLASIARHASDLPVIVVDNASSDRSAEVASSSPQVRLIRSEANEGFSKANNRALRTVETEFALILNPDARLTPSSIPGLLAAADREAAFAVLGPRTVFADGRPQVSFGPDLTVLGEVRQRRLVRGVKAGVAPALEQLRAMTLQAQDVDWVSGSCMLLRMKPALHVGFFDERYFLYEEDADLCLRLRRAGYRVRFVPEAEVIHVLGTSMAGEAKASRAAYDESHRLYYRLHRNWIERLVLEVLIAARR